MIELREPDSWLRFARIFDGYTEDLNGGVFLPERPRATDPGQKTQILAYLRGGHLLTAFRALANDQVDPSIGEEVPLVFVTDGEWVWSMGVAYYLDVHDLLPEQRLLDHIVACCYEMATIDPDLLERVEEEFFRVLETEPIDGTKRLSDHAH